MNKAIKKQIEELGELKLPALQARYTEVVGEETRAPNKTFLIRRIVAALESQAAREETVEETNVQDQTEPSIDVAENEGESEMKSSGQTKGLSVEQLREKYREVVGRETSSHDAGYLKWKIRQAEKGRIAVGPVQRRHGDGPPPNFKVLPLRMEAELVAQLDEARVRLGLNSRTEFFRQAISTYLADKGETDLAEMLLR